MLSRTAIDPGSLACILNGTETTHICPAFPLPGLTHLALIQLDFVLRCMMDWHRVHATLDSRPLQIVLRLGTSLLPFFLRALPSTRGPPPSVGTIADRAPSGDLTAAIFLAGIAFGSWASTVCWECFPFPAAHIQPGTLVSTKTNSTSRSCVTMYAALGLGPSGRSPLGNASSLSSSLMLSSLRV